jgi:hypothetical protein
MEATTLAVGCWHVWDARNEARNNLTERQRQKTSSRITAYLHMILQNCFKSKPITWRESSKPSKWTPPPQGEILVNFDAALFPDRRCMSVGAVYMAPASL